MKYNDTLRKGWRVVCLFGSNVGDTERSSVVAACEGKLGEMGAVLTGDADGEICVKMELFGGVKESNQRGESSN